MCYCNQEKNHLGPPEAPIGIAQEFYTWQLASVNGENNKEISPSWDKMIDQMYHLATSPLRVMGGNTDLAIMTQYRW